MSKVEENKLTMNALQVNHAAQMSSLNEEIKHLRARGEEILGTVAIMKQLFFNLNKVGLTHHAYFSILDLGRGSK
jgi:hypothetical protein